MTLELAFVLARGTNAFFVELAEILRYEAEALGISTSLTQGPMPAPAPERVAVVLPPHEYAALEGDAALADPAILARTIVIGAEQPGSAWFEGNVPWARAAAAAFDINPRGVRALRGRGVAAQYLALGYTARWDTSDDDWDRGRDIDVVFLASRTDRRETLLADCRQVLDRYTTSITMPDNPAPLVAGAADFLAGPEKHALMRRARVLLNLHRDPQPYFEWLRVVEAVHCGAVVVTEPSSDMEPLRPGRDCFAASPESLPWVLESVLANDARLARARRCALDALRARPMAGAAALLAFTAADIDRRATPVLAP